MYKYSSEQFQKATNFFLWFEFIKNRYLMVFGVAIYKCIACTNNFNGNPDKLDTS